MTDSKQKDSQVYDIVIGEHRHYERNEDGKIELKQVYYTGCPEGDINLEVGLSNA